jgi:putative zinc finger/helix-turn-helix YgiT family protein
MKDMSMTICPECQTEMVSGAHPIEVHVGQHTAESRSIIHERCPSCGYYELWAKDTALLELRSIQAVLHDIKELDPKALKFARKALGLTQKNLAVVLDSNQETISRYETGAITAPTEYRYALLGLIGFELQREQGGLDLVQVLPPKAA